jgi:hypothetical protein
MNDPPAMSLILSGRSDCTKAEVNLIRQLAELQNRFYFQVLLHIYYLKLTFKINKAICSLDKICYFKEIINHLAVKPNKETDSDGTSGCNGGNSPSG